MQSSFRSKRRPFSTYLLHLITFAEGAERTWDFYWTQEDLEQAQEQLKNLKEKKDSSQYLIDSLTKKVKKIKSILRDDPQEKVWDLDLPIPAHRMIAPHSHFG